MITDKAYREWIQRQPSCISGEFSEYVHGEGRCVAAHVRRTTTSGTGYKGEFSCVPMTQAEHNHQHQHGEAACLERFLGGKWTPEGAKGWFDERVREYLAAWKSLDARSHPVARLDR